MRLKDWTIPVVISLLHDLWKEAREQGKEVPVDQLLRRVAIHDSSIIERLRRVKFVQLLMPTISEVIESAPTGALKPEIRQRANTAIEYFESVAGFSGNDWRMKTQVVKGLIYQVCYRLEAELGCSDIARDFALQFYHHRWNEVRKNNSDARKELDDLATHVGLVWALPSLHAVLVDGFSPTEIAKAALKKYGHDVCRACFYPVCACGRVKGSGWHKVDATDKHFSEIDFPCLARSLAHCYDARNAMFGGPLEGASRWRCEANGESGWFSLQHSVGSYPQDVFNAETEYELEHRGRSGDDLRAAFVDDVSDGTTSWPPVYANGVGVPFVHAVRMVFRHVSSRLNIEIQLPSSPDGF